MGDATDTCRARVTRRDAVVQRLIEGLAASDAIEGAYLGGSLASGRADALSDIDIGLAAACGRSDEAWTVAQGLALEPGPPRRAIEGAWPGTRLLACLYSADNYPPIGLELDIAVSSLRDVDSQTLFAPQRVVCDRHGRLRAELASIPPAPTAVDTAVTVPPLPWWPAG